jgi:hypothetical protein
MLLKAFGIRLADPRAPIRRKSRRFHMSGLLKSDLVGTGPRRREQKILRLSRLLRAGAGC